MPITYHQSQTEVRVGDHVEFKVWLFSWRGWQSGRVEYVPGQSKKNPQMEFNGLSWICVRNEKMKVGVLVEPGLNCVKKTVRFIKRGDDGLCETPKDFTFEPDN